VIAIGTLVVLPTDGYARVFANYGTSVGVERVKDHRLVWVPEETVKPKDKPNEEEVVYG
jgi:hypothetical protein